MRPAFATLRMPPPRATPAPDTGPGARPSRVLERASERARTLHHMRGTILLVVSAVAIGQVLATSVWFGLLLAGNAGAAQGFGTVSLILSQCMTLVTVFLAWIILEALGRIERETDRVQQFMDNVYRRIP